VAPRAIAEQDVFQGRVIRPSDRDYDEARAVYNAIHDRRPALIVRAAGIDDVRAAIRLARERDLPLAIRGGGHSVAGFSTCDDGLVLDLGALRRIAVDPERRRVRADAGCTWGELNEAAHAHALATTGGVISTTGIAGLTLGGGLGFLARRCGLACDNLVSAEVVTADGEVVICDEQENADLLWGLRGGGGNFGVVTAFEYRLHPVPTTIGGPTVFPLDGDVLRRFDELVASAPEELGLLLGLALAPPLPFVPDEWHLKPVTVVLSCWTGDAERADEALGRVADLGTAIGHAVGPLPYPVMNTLFDELLPKGLRHYWKSVFVSQVADATVDLHVEHAARVPTLESGTFFFPVNGAAGRVPVGATAFPYRDARYGIGVFGTWSDPSADEQNAAWVREYYEALRPHSLNGGYVNFSAADEQNRVSETYRDNLDRLAQLKQRYDPHNVFRLNQNVTPAAS
jgi:FAD/FMN-containing dehydrogenase